MKVFTPCRKCNQKPSSRIPVGYYETEIEKDGLKYKVIVECEHHKVWRDSEDLSRQFKKAGFNMDRLDYDVCTYAGQKSVNNIVRLQNYINKFGDERIKAAIIYFYGPNGTQKTSVSNWIGRELIKRGFTAKYTTMKQLIDNLFEATRNEDKQDIIDQLAKTDLVIIDESFDKTKSHFWSSGIQIGYLDSFIRNRINDNKGIIFISNNKIFDIGQMEGFKSIGDLIDRETRKYNTNFQFFDNYVESVNVIPTELF